jgi:hypothetical protein
MLCVCGHFWGFLRALFESRFFAKRKKVELRSSQKWPQTHGRAGESLPAPDRRIRSDPLDLQAADGPVVSNQVASKRKNRLTT